MTLLKYAKVINDLWRNEMTFVTTQISSCPFLDTIELNKELENMTSPILQAIADIFANI